MKNFFFICVLISALLIAGCGKNETVQVSDEIDNEELTEEVKSTTGEADEKADVQETEDTGDDEKATVEKIENNGGHFVTYNGDAYYRQYQATDFEATGIFGDYGTIGGTTKNIMKISADDATQVAFADMGDGNIFMSQGRMYLNKSGADYYQTVYSVDLNGENEIEHGFGRVNAVDEETGIVIATLADENEKYQLSYINPLTMEVANYDLQNPCSEVIKVENGVIYYLGETEFEEAILGKLKLCSVNVDGTNELLLAETDADLYEFGDRGCIIPCFQIVDEEVIYFSYGAYGGTGNFFQGGRIARVNKDGSDFEICIGNQEEGKDVYETLVEESFLATSEGVYYSTIMEEAKTFYVDLKSGEITEAQDFLVQPVDCYFIAEGAICVFENGATQSTIMVPEIPYSSMDIGDEDLTLYTYDVKNMERVGDWFYYEITASELEEEADIGWREGSRRIKTQVFRQIIGSNEAEIMYEY